MSEQVNKEETKNNVKVKEQKLEDKTDSLTPSPQSSPIFVLYIDLHCVGCAKKIEKILLKMKGIEGVVIDMVNNQVTLKGLDEPQAICNKIMKKTKRMAKVMSSPSSPDAAADEPVTLAVDSEATELSTVELDVNMHCQACADQLKKKLLKIKGVQKVEIELKSSKVAVTGTMDSKELVNYVYQRTKKQAKIVPRPELTLALAEEKKKESNDQTKVKEEKLNNPKGDEPKAKEEVKKINKYDKIEEMIIKGMEHYEVMSLEEELMKKMYYFYPPQQPLYVVERLPPAAEIFSDENPNACTIC